MCRVIFTGIVVMPLDHMGLTLEMKFRGSYEFLNLIHAC